jgi:pilus assembly protein Flp/PilA
MTRVNRFLQEESGTTAVEYAVMLALIIAVCITAISSVGSTNDGSLKDSMGKLGSIMGGAS